MKWRISFLVKRYFKNLSILAGVLLMAFVITAPSANLSVAQNTPAVRLAYVHDNIVKLADAEGNPIAETGPEFQTGQAANLLWTPDGEQLYIARRNGLYVTGSRGGAAVQMPGNYGLTMAFNRMGDIIYYLESTNPAEGESPDFVTFPLREVNLSIMQGGTGRLIDYIGQYTSGSSQAVLSAAALQYARDGGLLGPSRPRLFPTYGTTLFYSCCFPNAGLNGINVATGEKYINYDPTFIPGPAALNSSWSRLAGPTTEGNLRVIDLISEGRRDYPLNNIGEVERVVWSLDDSAVYLAVRTTPTIPIELTPILTTQVDTRSANILIYRLDLVSGRLRQLATLGDFYGVSSIAATQQYVFVVVVERNERLVNDLNAGFLPDNLDPNDARLVNEYLPSTILFRIKTDGTESLSILTNVWGLAARPIRE